LRRAWERELGLGKRAGAGKEGQGTYEGGRAGGPRKEGEGALGKRESALRKTEGGLEKIEGSLGKREGSLGKREGSGGLGKREGSLEQRGIRNTEILNNAFKNKSKISCI
jgi:hypothetical protein